MRADQPSLTAIAVSFFRGIAALPGARRDVGGDPLAHEVLPGSLAALLRVAARVGPERARGRRALQALLAPLARHISLRTAAIDAIVERACTHDKVAQVVLLGAGLDMRAWRLQALQAASVWEVDHPATQRFKARKVEGRSPLASALRFVAVDFERERLEDKLLAAGFDPHQPTLWLWEGVTPYLHPDATRATLGTLRRLSAPASRAIISYALPGLVDLPPVLRPLLHGAFHLLGEPLRGALPQGAFFALLGDEGWRVEEEHGARTWAGRAGVPPPTLCVQERLVLVTPMLEAP